MADEGSLHRRMLARDVTALAEIYRHLAPEVFAAALRVTNDRQAAEDVTQETLLDLWRRPECFDPGVGGLRPWLRAVARNRSIDWIRRQEAVRKRDCAHLTRHSEPVLDVGDHVQALMTTERVRHALAQLTEPERTPIRLAYLHHRTYRQVAEDLEIAEGTIKTRIRSGLRHLSVALRDEQPA